MAKLFSAPNSGWIKARLYHLLAPLVALAVVGVSVPWAGDWLEYPTVSLRFQARAALDPPADPQLIFLGVDQQSLDLFGKWSWRRTVEANFLTNLAKAEMAPHTIAFDIMFTELSEHPEDDQALADACGLLPSVITGANSVQPSGDPEKIRESEEKTKADLKEPGPTLPLAHVQGDIHRIHGSEIATLPVGPLRQQSLFGFINDDPASDGIRHTIPLVLRVGEQIYPSFALQILCQTLGVDADRVVVNVGKEVVLKNAEGHIWSIPMTDKGDYYINYRRNESFQTASFGLTADALSKYVDDKVPLPSTFPELKNKTILFGEDATALGDNGPTPLAGHSPLPYTHLNVVNNVLRGDYLRFVPWYWVVIGWLLFTWVTLFRIKDALLIEAVGVPLVLAALYALIAFAIFWKWSVQIALAWPILAYSAVNFGGIVLRWKEEQRGREEIKRVFSRMLSPEIMGHLMEHPEHLEMGGSERPVTILFSDIRDYTKFSEGLRPTEVVRQLNLYFEPMVASIQECRGTLHKYIGDAIMAAWGDIADASLGAEQDARNAVRSALIMRRYLRELNVQRDAEGLTPMRIGIGLNHGQDVLVGLIGASSRSEFTVMGDAVNTASRLEGLTKEFHTDLAISESVRLLVGDEFLVRRLGLIVLKGKTKPTVVFEVLAGKDEPSESRMKPEAIARYEESFDHFLARRFAEAEKGFLACDAIQPDDYCVGQYLKASREFLASPPPPEWDGRIVMTTK